MRAAIFDLDGLLIDSEPLWQDAEIELFATVGHRLTRADCLGTKGLRLDEVVRHWHAIRPWESPSQLELAATIVERVRQLILERGRPLPGALEAVRLARSLSLKVAVASSSPDVLIEAALSRLGIASEIDVVRSAQHEALGKPHPAVLLSAAAMLGVSARDCVVLEDSVPGVIAAAAARMRCIVVPDPVERNDPRLVVADLRLDSLEQLTPAALLG